MTAFYEVRPSWRYYPPNFMDQKSYVSLSLPFILVHDEFEFTDFVRDRQVFFGNIVTQEMGRIGASIGAGYMIKLGSAWTLDHGLGYRFVRYKNEDNLRLAPIVYRPQDGIRRDINDYRPNQEGLRMEEEQWVSFLEFGVRIGLEWSKR